MNYFMHCSYLKRDTSEVPFLYRYQKNKRQYFLLVAMSLSWWSWHFFFFPSWILISSSIHDAFKFFLRPSLSPIHTYKHRQKGNVQFTYEILLHLAIQFSEKTESVKAVPGTDNHAITHAAPAMWSRHFENKSRKYFIDSSRRVCTCPLFQCMKSCSHILAALGNTVLEDLNHYSLDCGSVMPRYAEPVVFSRVTSQYRLTMNWHRALSKNVLCNRRYQTSPQDMNYHLWPLAPNWGNFVGGFLLRSKKKRLTWLRTWHVFWKKSSCSLHCQQHSHKRQLGWFPPENDTIAKLNLVTCPSISHALWFRLQ